MAKRSFNGYTLTSSQSESLRNAITASDISQNELGRKLGLDPSSMSRIMNGRQELTQIRANKIYKTLGPNKDLEFLIDLDKNCAPYSTALNQTFTVDQGYQVLLESYFGKLREVHTRQTNDQRLTLINDLEQLVRKYEPKTDS